MVRNTLSQDISRTTAGFASRIDNRYFEDYEPGSVHEFGDISVSAEEIIGFAQRYDPQDFHTDAETAARSRFGGLIASGRQMPQARAAGPSTSACVLRWRRNGPSKHRAAPS